KLQYSAESFHFVMQPYGVFEQLFALVRHEINQGIGPEAEHPITRQPVQEGGDAENDRAQGQQSLNQENSRQTWKADRMIEYRCQPPSVDFLFPCELCLAPQPVSKQRSGAELLHQGLARFPDMGLRRLCEEPQGEPRPSLVRNGGIKKVEQGMRSGHIQV